MSNFDDNKARYLYEDAPQKAPIPKKEVNRREFDHSFPAVAEAFLVFGVLGSIMQVIVTAEYSESAVQEAAGYALALCTVIIPYVLYRWRISKYAKNRSDEFFAILQEIARK